MRRWCRKLLGPSCDFLLFLRPRQWPILTVQLAVSMLLAPACVAAWRAGGAQPLEPAAWRSLLASWLAWVVCLNGGTLAYNSAYDRDVQDIAYLRAPPPPLPGLAPLALALMILGTALAFSVAFAFGAVTGSCLLLSVAYSHPACRWKGVAALDLMVNMVGYGAGTTLAGMLVGQHLLGPEGGMPDRAGWLLVGAFALLFGSFYPLSQIYQISEDRRRGDHTLAVSLGVRGSLMLSLVLGSLAGAFFLAARLAGHDPSPPVLILPPVAGLLVWLGHTAVWLGRAGRWSSRDHERGMYRALAFWAVIDLTVVVSWYGQRWLR